jgi:hypothetical protein
MDWRIFLKHHGFKTSWKVGIMEGWNNVELKPNIPVFPVCRQAGNVPLFQFEKRRGK